MQGDLVFWLKSLHIIGVVVWFSGLFYLGRLFVYHQEASEKPEYERKLFENQFALMEKRLWYAITQPGMVLTVVMGTALIMYWGFQPWLHVKLFLIALLLGYHYWCGLVRKQLLEGTCKMTGKHLRMFNEIPTLLLISIVFMVVFKNAISFVGLGIGILILTVLIVGIVVALQRKVRNSQQ
ncbi:MAG: protoporphyrinogen oxidase HemJ [SAR324 cluster bacterium]|nr:protoporphyrinogen oxidase HemJ [SAR324 cluster bacterium]